MVMAAQFMLNSCSRLYQILCSNRVSMCLLCAVDVKRVLRGIVGWR